MVSPGGSNPARAAGGHVTPRPALQPWADLGVLRQLAVADAAPLTTTLTDARLQRLVDEDPGVLPTVAAYLDAAE